MIIDNDRLLKFLLDTSIIKAEDLRKLYHEAEKKQRNLGDVLMEGKFISRDNLKKIIAYIYGVPYIDISKIPISPVMSQLLTMKYIERQQIYPYMKVFNTLEVAMVDPTNINMIQILKQKTGLYILPRYTTEEIFMIAMDNAKKDGNEVFVTDSSPELAASKLHEASKNPTYKSMASLFLEYIVTAGGQELNIENFNGSLHILINRNGSRSEIAILPGRYSNEMIAVFKAMAGLDYLNMTEPQRGSFRHDDIQFSISSRQNFNGESLKICMQNTPLNAGLNRVEINDEDLKKIEESVQASQGLILVTGDEKSGKTRMLYSLIKSLDPVANKISTLEDSVEYLIPKINQIEIDKNQGMNKELIFEPVVGDSSDIIMIDELDNDKQINTATQAAMAGKLVLASYQAKNIFEALDQLLMMDVRSFYISGSLNLIIGQKLVKKLCPVCKTSRDMYKKEIQDLLRVINVEKVEKLLSKNNYDFKIDRIPFYEPRGCKYCHKEGFSGVTSLYEVLDVSPAVEDIIEDKNWVLQKDEIIMLINKQMVLNMLEDGIMKAATGLTSMGEIFSHFIYNK